MNNVYVRKMVSINIGIVFEKWGFPIIELRGVYIFVGDIDMKHAGTKIIETERLILRRFKLTDAQAMYKNWANDSEVTKFLTWKPHSSVEILKNIIKSWVNDYKNKNYELNHM